jgi:hypothetical protein
VFTVSLGAAQHVAVAVNYTTMVSGSGSGSATAGLDYTATSGTVTFPPGALTRTVAVAVVDDDLDEDAEAFAVALSGATGGVAIGRSVGVATILASDGVALTANDAAFAEGDSGTATHGVNVTLSNPSAFDITLSYTVSAAASAPAATAGVDFTAVTAGAGATVVVPAGATVVAVPVAVLGDTDVEQFERFVVTVTSASRGTIAAASATVTILDDDAAQFYVPALLSVGEGGGGSGSGDIVHSITVYLTTAAATTATVDYSITDLSATGGGIDYTAVTGTLTFAPGETQRL